ncbi:hypothetical protein J2S44_000437 [Catenuloplanes niger]|uniref:Uncharacterized protein n=1 Tax=Catenuloplanes niger TaxID=587534 RepID=A0AAE4CQ65_9ACTN|nr:hypothetical protein [Catenuloplanes niger]
MVQSVDVSTHRVPPPATRIGPLTFQDGM